MTTKELYEFKDDDQSWYFTSADSDEEYNGNMYTAVTLGRTEFESKNSASRASIEVTFDINNEVARRWLKYFYDTVTTLTIYEKSDSTTAVIWKGRLISIKPTKTSIIFILENVFTSMKRSGVASRFQKTCRHALYNRGCNVNKEDFANYGSVTAVSEDALTFTIPIAANKEDGYYTGGMIKGNDGYFRFVISHYGSTIVLQQPNTTLKEDFLNSGWGLNYGNLYGGFEVALYAGCDRLRSTCRDKFNNLLNSGAFPFIPAKNPVSGSSII